MASKPNIRSIRFSDELAELIDRQAGNTFTEKFENLVTRCVWELPQKEEELKRLQEQISLKQKRLYDLEDTVQKLQQMERDIKHLQRSLNDIMGRAEAVVKAAEEDLIYL
ncbi:hypothetical protein [uncultured Oscillibacter sp.]|uniref:hypothetical protein n=1 Tax=uncultured Oscillibacter sp. TaxID=876091 RepID=UPI002631B43C|nr:hypothetical protein [uncultured Oscillibacter sp.]